MSLDLFLLIGFGIVLAGLLGVLIFAHRLHRRAVELRQEAEELEERVKRMAELLRKTQPPKM